MNVRLSFWIEKIQTLFWVIPVLVIFAIVSCLFILDGIKLSGEDPFYSFLIYNQISVEGSRHILESIASSVMTVVGVLFSISIVVLQKVATQYTPRVISNFVRSNTSQIVMGFYIGTFIYCLLLLAENYGDDPIKSNLTLSFAIVLAVVCLFLLIYYIHHLSTAIQSTQIVHEITQEAKEAITEIINDRKEFSLRSMPKKEQYEFIQVVTAATNGYVQNINWKDLGNEIEQDNWCIEILINTGFHVQQDQPLAKVHSLKPLAESNIEHIRSNVSLGMLRTHTQDPEYGIRQLVDISLKALSPGINDPSTAIEAIHGITSIYHLFVKVYPLQNLIEVKDNCYIELMKVGEESFISHCYDQIIQHAQNETQVLELIQKNISFVYNEKLHSALKVPMQRRINYLDQRLTEVKKNQPWVS